MRECLSLTFSAALITVAMTVTATAERQRKPRESIELAPKNRQTLAQLRLTISDASTPAAETVAVTDLLLVAIKRGGDAAAALSQSNSLDSQSNEPAFAVRLFIVAGGRLYSDTRALCGPWTGGVTRCAASCDGGTFALRRTGPDVIDFQIGAAPATPDDDNKKGVALTACDTEASGETRLVPVSHQGLASVGLASEAETD